MSILILTVWQVFYMNPRIERDREVARIEQERLAQEDTATTPGEGVAIPGAPAGNVPGGALGVGAASRDSALAAGGRVRIDTPSLTGSINLTGARIDDLLLKDYRVTVEKDSPIIDLLNPAALPTGYFAEIGYTGGATPQDFPGPDAVWSVEGQPVLTADSPVTLTYESPSGIIFSRTVSVDRNYMFTFTDSIANPGTTAVSLANYGRITRFSKPDHASIYVLHEGLIGVTGTEGLQEIKYSTLEEDLSITPSKSTNGWLGITDKYWAVALVPQPGQAFQPRYTYQTDQRARFQADYLTDAISIAPGATQTVETRLFAGAKQVSLITGYEEQLQIQRFDLLIDWGWFYFITKPMFWLIDHLFNLLGNFGLAILATTVIVKAIFFPLANKSYKSMANMKKVQPKLLEIREKYADDKMKQQQAMMELYKTEKINPIAGCWPILIQIPVFFALYKVLYVTIEMRHAPFFGWIRDLAAPDPTSVFNLFGLLPYDVPSFLMIGVWPLIMGVTMFLQMRMNPTPPDPTQAMIFNWMPVVFTFMLATFPAGLVIYWAWNNSLSVLQQGYIMRKHGTKIELWDNVKELFGKKKTPAA